MNKALFLDRDGILIRERGEYNYRDEDIEIVQGSPEALRELQARGYILIVITNQGGIARGLYSHARVREIHTQLKAFYAEFGVHIKEFLYCPHHPSVSNCLCRKPDSQMLEKAIARFKIDPAASWFIGDNERDVLAGQKAGVQTLLVPSNADLRDFVREVK